MSRLTLLISTLVLAALIVIVRPDQRTTQAVEPLSGTPRVKLAVVLVFDQMRGDFVQRWRPLFGPDGFQRIQTDGAWFPNCYYPYASTSTGPGHSAILSGATLDKTGIINNEWYDRKAGSQVYCAGSDRYDFVPAAKPSTSSTPRTTTTTRKKVVGNPDKMLAETVADVLKRETQGRGKVFGLSLKDRSAILPTGKKPDGVYWFSGKFQTSTYYTDTLPAWVAEFNQSGYADHWYGKDWVKFRPDLDYAAYSGPDEVASESKLNGRGVTFPHKMTGGKDKLGSDYYSALANSPMGNDLLLAFTKKCIEAEQLGRDEIPDLLVVSFSSNDLVGHTFGPDSQEVLDTTLRSDALLADLLKYLDRTVGEGQYSVTISADHGVSPMPEVAAATIPEAKGATRVNAVKLLVGAENHLRTQFGKPDQADENLEELGDEEKSTTGKAGLWIEAASAPWVYLNTRQLEARKLDRNVVAKSLANWLKTQPGIANAYTADEIAHTANPDPMLKLLQNSFLAERCGDVYILLKPYHLVGDPLKSRGTSHGTPYDYDRHVPLMVYGPGLAHGSLSDRVTPQHMASIVSYFLGVARPKDASYELPKSLLVE